MSVALWLTRGRQITFPVFELDGERIGDSTAIIAALERLKPDPPLYPTDPDERRRALALEDWFDEHFVPPLRRLFFSELSCEPSRFGAFLATTAPLPLARLKRLGAACGHAFIVSRYGATRRAAEAARAQVLAGLDRLESELGDSDYLVGGRFTVADLGVAACMHPLVLPPQGPVGSEVATESWRRFQEPLRDRRGFRWVEQIYRRHRRPQPV